MPQYNASQAPQMAQLRELFKPMTDYIGDGMRAVTGPFRQAISQQQPAQVPQTPQVQQQPAPQPAPSMPQQLTAYQPPRGLAAITMPWDRGVGGWGRGWR